MLGGWIELCRRCCRRARDKFAISNIGRGGVELFLLCSTERRQVSSAEILRGGAEIFPRCFRKAHDQFLTSNVGRAGRNYSHVALEMRPMDFPPRILRGGVAKSAQEFPASKIGRASRKYFHAALKKRAVNSRLENWAGIAEIFSRRSKKARCEFPPSPVLGGGVEITYFRVALEKRAAIPISETGRGVEYPHGALEKRTINPTYRVLGCSAEIFPRCAGAESDKLLISNIGRRGWGRNISILRWKSAR
jgi:hypothetical protein